MTKTVLITGVTGFIGRYVARLFAEDGWQVVGIGTRPPENAPTKNLAHYQKLFLPDDQLIEIIQKYPPDLCVHCAGRAAVGLSVEDPKSDFMANASMTFHLLDTLRVHAHNCRMIYLSSAAVYGNPTALPVSENQPISPISPYGFHKLMSEQLCQEFSKIYNLQTASLRIFSAYGPGLRRQVLWDICQQLILYNTLHLKGTGQESRDFIHGLDVAKAIKSIALNAPMNGEVYNVGTGREITIRELSKKVVHALDLDITPEFDQVEPIGIPLNWQADISQLQSLGFQDSVTLDQGLKTFVYWCRAELVGV